jgi:hypothetical protein
LILGFDHEALRLSGRQKKAIPDRQQKHQQFAGSVSPEPLGVLEGWDRTAAG